MEKMTKKIDMVMNIIKTRNFNLGLISSLILLKIKKYFKVGFNPIDSDMCIVDIVIPTILKDEPLLLQVIEALKVNLCHKINNIYIVSKDSKSIKELCLKHGFIFIDEVTVLGYGKDSIEYFVNGIDRSGWIFQQLLKLSSDKFVKMKNYVVVDSDTVLINKTAFMKGNSAVLFQSEEWYEPYVVAYRTIYKQEPISKLSFVAHMMIFNVDKIKEMKKQIELTHKKSWDYVFLSTINKNEQSCVSEYFNYGNWQLRNYPKEVITIPFYNKTLSRQELCDSKILKNKYGNKYNSISFHKSN